MVLRQTVAGEQLVAGNMLEKPDSNGIRLFFCPFRLTGIKRCSILFYIPLKSGKGRQILDKFLRAPGAVPEERMNYGVVVAAGQSKRMGQQVDKAFLSLGNMPVLAYSLGAFEKCQDIDGVVLVVRKDRVESAWAMVRMYGFTKVKSVLAGGAMRQTSVSIGLKALREDVQIVSVHDGARPCVTPQLISDTIKIAKRYGSGVAGVPLSDTVKYVERGLTVKKTLDRNKLWAVQTPQTFRLDLLRDAMASASRKKKTLTDEASALELYRKEVRLVQASVANIKITAPDDLMLAAAILKV